MNSSTRTALAAATASALAAIADHDLPLAKGAVYARLTRLQVDRVTAATRTGAKGAR